MRPNTWISDRRDGNLRRKKYSATTQLDEDRYLSPAILLFEKDIKGEMSREILHVSRCDSVHLLTAVVIRRGSRYRTTASVTAITLCDLPNSDNVYLCPETGLV